MESWKSIDFVLGSKKSMFSPRLKLTAQGMAQYTDDQSQVWYHSAIQAPQKCKGLVYFLYITLWSYLSLGI